MYNQCQTLLMVLNKIEYYFNVAKSNLIRGEKRGFVPFPRKKDLGVTGDMSARE